MRRLVIPLIGILFSIAASKGAEVHWSGQIVDIRTGKPIPEARVYGGGSGRVDLTPAATSDAGGNFNVTYDNALDLTFWKYYGLEVGFPPEPNLYFTHVSAHGAPTNVIVRMVPRAGHFTGVLRDKVTGQAIAGGSVSIGRPGVYLQTIKTGEDGQFQFTTPAYDTAASGANWEEGIAPENWAPHEPSRQPKVFTNYWIEAGQTGYQKVNTSTLGLNLPLVSSVSTSLHTHVVLEIVPDGSAQAAGASVELVEPFAFENWLAQQFTPTELADASITGVDSDPDADGLSNRQEFEAATHPKIADTDGDGLPDGWEVIHGLAPLTGDSADDTDLDGYSNALEFLYSTDPTSGASAPDTDLEIARAVRIEFNTIVGVNYQLQTGTTVSGPWQNSGDPIPGNGQIKTFYFDGDASQHYYRVLPSVP